MKADDTLHYSYFLVKADIYEHKKLKNFGRGDLGILADEESIIALLY
jgi:hypothetical protein